MARTNRMVSGSQNPATKFFQWKSEHQKFAYYDKIEKENVFVEMPFKFLALSRYKTVKGWNQKKEGAIISNEVKDLKDQLIVNFYPKNGNGKEEIVRGVWSDIKPTIENWDGKYTESVYAMLEDGSVVNIQLSGASLSTWFDFQKNQTNMFFDNWVVINGFKEGKQGAVNYTFPIFEWGGSLNEDFQELAEIADSKIESYESGYFGKTEEDASQKPSRERSEVDKYESNSAPIAPNEAFEPVGDLNEDDHDDLPF